MPNKSAEGYRRFYQDISGSLAVAAATDDTTLVAAKTNHTIFIQRIIFYVTTNAAVSMSFEDTNGTPLQGANIPASPGDDTRWDFDFGDRGFPLTEEKGLVMNVSAAGLAGNLVWEGYSKRTKVAAA
jgi:hypothetical protein